MTDRFQLLDLAKAAVTQRADSYGRPEDCFEAIALLWGDYLNTPITAHDVALMMVPLKVVRARTDLGDDSLADICGYAACAAELSGEAR